jgi:hypothetical protein
MGKQSEIDDFQKVKEFLKKDAIADGQHLTGKLSPGGITRSSLF